MSKTGTGVFPAAVRAGWLVVCLLLTRMIAASLPAQEPPPQTEEQRQAREALNKGVQDFKNGQADEAIADFQWAKQLDPQLLNARLYLATAYASLYIPGAPLEENRSKGEAAIAEFREVLNVQPENLSAIHSAPTDNIGRATTSVCEGNNSRMMNPFHLKCEANTVGNTGRLSKKGSSP
jgi:tetratricopeptide (TPR) repeat protein